MKADSSYSVPIFDNIDALPIAESRLPLKKSICIFINKLLINGIIDEDEAISKINYHLPNGVKMQYALREKVLDERYFVFYDSYVVKGDDI